MIYLLQLFFNLVYHKYVYLQFKGYEMCVTVNV